MSAKAFLLALWLLGFAGQSAVAQAPPAFAPSFRFAGSNVTAFAATATDWITITGAAGKKVQITNITLSGTATAPATIDVLVVRRSAVDSGGTSTAVAAAPIDTASETAGAVVAIYTANPTITGTTGIIDPAKLNLGVPGSAGFLSFDYGTRANVSALTLRGPTEQIAINLNGVTLPTGAAISWRIEETECTNC